MAKKVDMFKAAKAMSERVSEYMHTQVWNVVVKTRLRKAMEKLEQELDNLESLRGSIITDEQIDAMAQAKQAEFAKYEEELKALADKESTFSFTEADKEFYKAYKLADKDAEKIQLAVITFCGVYGLDVEGTDLLVELTDGIRGVRKASASQIVKSGATQFTSARTKNDVLTVLYGIIAERMLKAGTLKPESIPVDVRKAYESNKRK